jgi:hypothetical protein
MAEEIYQRLAKGRGLFSLSRHSLWLGSDHLLSVQNHNYTESYRRFYFKDIQALLIRPSRQGYFWTALFLLGVGGAALLMTNEEAAAKGFGLGFGLFFLLLLIIHWWKGSTCHSYLKTAVSQEELPALGRRPTATRVIQKIYPLIEASQSHLRTTGLEHPVIARASSTAVTPVIPPLRPLVSLKDRMHVILFAGNVLLAVLMGLTLGLQLLPAQMAMFAVSALLFVLNIVCLARQNRSTLPGASQKLAWVSMTMLAVLYALLYIEVMVDSFATMVKGKQTVDFLELLLALEIYRQPIWSTIYGVWAVIQLLIGLGGLVSLVSKPRSS